MNEKMIARQHLLTEMELVKSTRTLTPEERKMEVRRHMLIELKAMEMERRQKVSLEIMEKCKRDREEREKVTESQRRRKERTEERMRQEALENITQDQLKKERLQWKKVMTMEEEEEEDVKRPWSTSSAMKEVSELCRLPLVGDKADPESLTTDMKSAEMKKQTLYNNWVGEEKTDSSIYLLCAAKPGPESEEKPKRPNTTLQWVQDRLKVGHLVDEYRDYTEKKHDKRKRKAEEQYARWTTYKNSCANQYSQLHDCYTGGFAINRNSTLKCSF